MNNNFSDILIASLFGIGYEKNNNAEIIEWVNKIRDNTHIEISKIKFKDLNQWKFDQYSNLSHSSGKFFKIRGLSCFDSSRKISWDQPIIDQPEIGFLGILCKEIKGSLHFLLQAKIEPGNKNFVQLSPTLQATRSITRVHGGKKPEYLDYFTNLKSNKIIVDCLQSEQGSRFFKKRNRNIIIYSKEKIELKENFKWLTLKQIKDLMLIDNFINMDTRTVISCLNIADYINKSSSKFEKYGNEFYHSINNQKKSEIQNVLHRFINYKFKLDSNNYLKQLNQLNDWIINDYEIAHNSGNYFKIIANKIEISSREVISWDQPMVQPVNHGDCILFIKKINNIINILAQIKSEPGIFDNVELGPTIQTNNLENYIKDPFIKYFIENKNDLKYIHDSYQSEEGGRFYREENRNVILELDEELDWISKQKNHFWIPLSDALLLNSINNLFNIQLRSLISLISYSV